MPERLRDRGSRRGRQHLMALGTEVRSAREAAGLSQTDVAGAAGLSHAEVSRIERSLAPWLKIVDAAELCAVVGLDLWLRAYPGDDPLRDGHVALLGRFLAHVDGSLLVRTEVPLPRRGDPRAWDATVADRTGLIGVEAETRLRDGQALERRIALKRRDGGIDRVVIVVANTRANRSALRAIRPSWRADYPLDTEEILGSIRAGKLPPAGGVSLI